MDETFVDGSKQAGHEEQVKAQMAIFFETCANGAVSLKSMRDVHASSTVVALYGLICISRCEFKAGQSFFEEVASGTYAKLALLQAGASETVAAPAIFITKEWQPTPEISKKNNVCFLFADWLLLSYALHLVVALQSLPLRLRKGSATYFKLTTATSPLPAQETSCSPRMAIASGSRTFGSLTRRGASRLSCARRPPSHC